MNSNVKFEPFPKQQEFINAVFSDNYETLIYGGAFAGGKSYVLSAVACMLGRVYPGSKWAIMRESMPTIKRTILETFKKLYPTSFYRCISRSPDIIYEGKNGSQIIFMSENFSIDPDLNRLKSLEVNGFIFEQIEEIQRYTYTVAHTRCRWKSPAGVDVPKKMIASINPTQDWPKEEFYEPHRNEALPDRMYFLEAKVQDNPVIFNDPVQMASFDFLDPIMKARFLDGDWDAVETDNLWAYMFSLDKHIGDTPPVDPTREMYISFDFNKNPMSVTLTQHDHNYIHHKQEWSIKNSDTIEACDRIMAEYGQYNYNFMVTGDASGRHGDTRSRTNDWLIIKQKLDLATHQIRVGRSNPSVAETRRLFNGMLANFPEIIFSRSGCQETIKDMKKVKAYPDGTLIKDKGVDIKLRTHMMDNIRYYYYAFWGDWFYRRSR